MKKIFFEIFFEKKFFGKKIFKKKFEIFFGSGTAGVVRRGPGRRRAAGGAAGGLAGPGNEIFGGVWSQFLKRLRSARPPPP